MALTIQDILLASAQQKESEQMSPEAAAALGALTGGTVGAVAGMPLQGLNNLKRKGSKFQNMNYIKYEILNPLVEHIVQQLYPYFIKMIIIVIIFFILIIFIIILNLRIIYT